MAGDALMLRSRSMETIGEEIKGVKKINGN
jgi:hypothetical protein